ncbi:MAG TPA: Uma2 family endonuclease [Acidimicrobiales bacterium]|nr:Uma2 family endonuclease [Acidimicrobiales bacterium]
MVQIQNPIILDDRSEPQPDVALLRSPVDRYLTGHPGPTDIFLLIEVADSSLGYHRDTKAPLYGRAGVTETWVVDLDREVVLVLRRPGPDRYRERREVGRGDRLEMVALPEMILTVDDVLGPLRPA